MPLEEIRFKKSCKGNPPFVCKLSEKLSNGLFTGLTKHAFLQGLNVADLLLCICVTLFLKSNVIVA